MPDGKRAMIEKPRFHQAGNVFARRPVVEMRIARDARPALAPDASRRLFAALPPMREEVLDFAALKRVLAAEGPVPAAAAIEALALLAQRYMNWPVRFCAWRPGRETSRSRAVFEIGTRRAGLTAGALAIETLDLFLSGGSDAAIAALFREKLSLLSRMGVGESPSIVGIMIARAAAARGIPWNTLPNSVYLRLGWGRHAHVVRGSETTRTSSIGSKLAQRKRLASAVLKAAGLPMAAQRQAHRLEDAVAAARSIGFPVVVKPANGNQGKGVTVGVASEADIGLALARAQAISRNVLIEAFIPGEEYRLLVVNGRFAAATLRRPAQVRGDGSSTVRQLVERENARPEREAILPGQMAARLPIALDAEARSLLAEQGLSEEAIPAADQVVLLRRESNVSRGGDSVDATDRVHASIRDVAERAARALAIDVCGVDFISSDIGRPWQETGAAICEVNTRPGLILHARVSEGQRRDVAVDVVAMLYPDGQPARIPVVAVLEGPTSTRLVASIAAAAKRAGCRLGVVCRWEADLPFGPGVKRLDSAADLAWDESIEMGVVETAAAAVAQHGLGLEQIDLAIVPPASSPGAAARAATALARVAGRQTISPDDPGALDKALQALGLPQTATTAPVAVTARRRAEGDDRSFTALMVGDIGFGESYLHFRRAAPLHDLLAVHGREHCFARLAPMLEGANLVIGNLEAPLSAEPDEGLKDRKKYLGWSDPDPSLRALSAAGISAVSLANNHALDCGAPGLAETIGRLEAGGIAAFGAGSDLETAERPLIVSFRLSGVERSLVVFAGFEHRPRYERRYGWYARSGAAGVNPISASRIAAAIAELRERLPSPTFIAYPHWGTDYEGVADRQRSYAAALVEAGIDLIVGHGSHIAQEIALVDGRPVIYGLGNFVWNTPGRYEKLNVKPFGAAVALGFHADRPEEIRLRIYPILADNGLTGFQNRPVTEWEFAEARREIATGLRHELQHGTDSVGHYLDMTTAMVTTRATRAVLRPPAGAAGDLLVLPDAPLSAATAPGAGPSVLAGPLG